MPRIGGSPRAALAYQPDDAEEGVGDDIIVKLDDYRSRPAEPTFEMRDDEAVETKPEHAPYTHNGEFSRNLALDYDEKFLDDLGCEICELLEEDIEEDRPWQERFERGLEMMGLVESDIDDGPFPGASNVVHPLLIEAVTQFWARAMGELWPPEGPALGKVLGQQTEDKNARAERVSEYMNFEMTILDEGYMSETSRLVWAIPFYGSAFRKTFRDPALNQNVGIYVARDDMIVPASASDLKTTPRFAHRMRKTPNEVRRLQVAGHYRKCDLELPADEEADETEDLKDRVQDTERTGHNDKSTRHELFECCIERNLEGDEHAGADGEETGLERSYTITVDRHTQKVLSIYRTWDENDVLCRRKLHFEHYRYVPGPKFYGLGLLHLIGGLQVAATGALRVLLDSAASASLSGGFVSKHANLKGKRLTLTPGHWEPVDASAEDLQKAFYSPPVKEPSPALFQLLGLLTERSEKFTSTTELMTGDQDPKGAPVGTTNMMLEQGGKVMSTIHRMMHESLGRELRLRYELCRLNAPPDGYPYDVAGQQRTVYSDDFAPGVSVVPVSDPNIFSSSQRIAQAQTILQVALQTGVIPIKKAVRRFFQAQRIADIDDLVPDDPQPQSYDPVGEIQALFLGKAVKVDPAQPHVMHLQVLSAFASNPQFGGNEQVQKQIGPALLSVIAQHMAYAWTTHARGLGAQVGFMDPNSGQIPRGAGTPEQIAAVLAQMAPQLATVPGLPPIDDGKGGKGDGKEQLQIEYAKLEMEKEKHTQKMQMEQQKHQFALAKDQSKLEAEKAMNAQKIQVAAQKAQGDMQIAKMKADQAAQQSAMEGQIAQQTAQQKMAHDQQAMHQEAQMGQHKMQQEATMGQQEMQHKHALGQQQLEQGHLEGQQKAQLHQQEQTLQQGGGDKLRHLRHPTAPPHDPGTGQGGL